MEKKSGIHQPFCQGLILSTNIILLSLTHSLGEVSLVLCGQYIDKPPLLHKTKTDTASAVGILKI